MFCNRRFVGLSCAGLLLALLVGGCGANPIGVPRGASIHAQGDHPVWTAFRPGTVYVYDATSGSTVYQGHVDANQDVSVDPVANDVTIDGQPVEANRLTRGHHYQIFFEPAAARG